MTAATTATLPSVPAKVKPREAEAKGERAGMTEI
jgi:hypothetical protein